MGQAKAFAEAHALDWLAAHQIEAATRAAAQQAAEAERAARMLRCEGAAETLRALGVECEASLDVRLTVEAAELVIARLSAGSEGREG